MRKVRPSGCHVGDLWRQLCHIKEPDRKNTLKDELERENKGKTRANQMSFSNRTAYIYILESL